MRCELPDGNRMAHGVVVGVSKAISCGTITTSSLVTTINEHRQTAKCVLSTLRLCTCILKLFTFLCATTIRNELTDQTVVLPEYVVGGSTNRPSPQGEF
jgi:hypothetical protein